MYSKERIDVLLKGIGKGYFINNYFELKNDNKINDENYSAKSFNSRLSKSKKIFKENKQMLALQNCIESPRLGSKTIAKAKRILDLEVESEFKLNYVSEIRGYRLTRYIGENMHVVLPKYYNNQLVKEVVESGREFFPLDYEVETLYIPNSIESINNMGFYAMTKLKEVFFEIDSNLKFIGGYAFGHSHSLKEIIIPKSVEEIGDHALGWSGLERFIVEKNSLLEKIGQTIFVDCKHLKEIVIPKQFLNKLKLFGFDSL